MKTKTSFPEYNWKTILKSLSISAKQEKFISNTSGSLHSLPDVVIFTHMFVLRCKSDEILNSSNIWCILVYGPKNGSEYKTSTIETIFCRFTKYAFLSPRFFFEKCIVSIFQNFHETPGNSRADAILEIFFDDVINFFTTP